MEGTRENNLCASLLTYATTECVCWGFPAGKNMKNTTMGNATKLKSGKYGGDYQQARTGRPPP